MNASPMKFREDAEDIYNGDTLFSPEKSKSLNWMSSPFSQLEAMSPNSNLSFSPNFRFSPAANSFSPNPGHRKTPNSRDLLTKDSDTIFSPSIFGPPVKLLKKRGMLDSNDMRHAHLGSSGLHKVSDDMDIALIPDMEDVDFNNESPTAAPRLPRIKAKSSKKVRLDLDMDVNADDNDALFLDHDPTFLEELNSTDKCANGNPNTPGSIYTSSSQKPYLNSAKKSKNASNQFYSSPATILRPTKPSNMSPDMILAQKKSGCNCKKSKCLKLYCECFKAQIYCDGCECIDCNNLSTFEEVRQNAIKVTKERNITAFQSKVIVKGEKQEHNAGCNCKRSHCVKKYCECYEESVFCSESCKCLSCYNYDGFQDTDESSSATGSTPNKSSVDSSSERSPASSIPDERDSSTPRKLHKMISPGSISFKRHQRKSNDDEETDGGAEAPRRSQPGEHMVTRKSAAAAAVSTTFASSVSHSEERDTSSENDASGKKSKVTSTKKGSKPAPLKKRKVKFVTLKEPLYPFFGENRPMMTKLTALRCLDFLDTKDLYSVSLVNHLWSKAAMDDALWE